jgi:hypothetical protein
MLANGLGEVGAAAMHRDHGIGLQLPELGHHLIEIISRRRS